MDGLAMVFERWLDVQALTDHGAPVFRHRVVLHDGRARALEIKQHRFCHEPDDDRTGAVCWDDAVVLAKFIERNREVYVKRGSTNVIELGAGTGFVGLVAGCLGAKRVYITDRNVMMELIRKNISGNGLESVCIGFEHEWGTPIAFDGDPNIKFDLILASGCVYHEEATPALLKTLQTLVDRSEDCVLLLAIDFRFDVSSATFITEEDQDRYFACPVIKSFINQAIAQGWAMRPISTDQLHPEYIKPSVKVYECRFVGCPSTRSDCKK